MIVDPSRFVLFVVSGLTLNVTPGPDMLFVLAAGTSSGRGGGARAALGVGLGSVVHTLAAALGVSAILASSASAFGVVKLAGAIYLVWLGARAIVLRDPPADASTPDRRVFLRAAATNVLNPKVALFYLAFVPQFVDAARGHVALQFALLGLTFCTTGTLVNLAVGLAAERVGHLLRARMRWLRRATGAVFVALGARLALSPS